MAMTCQKRLTRANNALCRLQNGRKRTAKMQRRISHWVRSSSRDLHLIAFVFSFLCKWGPGGYNAIRDSKGNWWVAE